MTGTSDCRGFHRCWKTLSDAGSKATGHETGSEWAYFYVVEVVAFEYPSDQVFHEKTTHDITPSWQNPRAIKAPLQKILAKNRY